MLDDIDLFLALERAVFLDFKIPQPFVTALLSDLAFTLNAFRVNPEGVDIGALREAISETTEAACGLVDEVANTNRLDFLIDAGLRIALTLSVLGGTINVVLNAAKYQQDPAALNSVITGSASIFGFAGILKLRKRR